MGNTFKFKITKENGKVSGISVLNRQIHAGLFKLLNDNAHKSIMEFNGELDWYDTFIRFEHNGKAYTQIKANPYTCTGCCFLVNNRCTHPHFNVKPICSGKIYIEEKQ